MSVTVVKIVMATNNSGLNSTYLLTSEDRRKRERRERQRARLELSGEELAKRIAEEKCFYLHLVTCLLIAETDRVLCNLIMFNRLFALDLLKYSCY